MSIEHHSHLVSIREPSRFFLRAWFDALAQRFPFLALFLTILVSNLAGSIFSFFYNKLLIVEKMTEAQQNAFWFFVAPLYNALAYPLCLGVLVCLIVPLHRCLKMLRRGEPVEPAFLQYC